MNLISRNTEGKTKLDSKKGKYEKVLQCTGNKFFVHNTEIL
jgi:hypothetical protein